MEENKKKLYELHHSLWKSKVLIERAQELVLKTIENESNMPFLEVVLDEIAVGMVANLKTLIDEE